MSKNTEDIKTALMQMMKCFEANDLAGIKKIALTIKTQATTLDAKTLVTYLEQIEKLSELELTQAKEILLNITEEFFRFRNR